MKELLETLEALLNRINAPLLYSLKNGLDENSIKNIQDANHFHLPGEVTEFYKWKNGSTTDYDPNVGDRYFLNRGIWMPLTKAFAEYNYFNSNDFEYYLESYFPLFESMGEEFMVIDCNPNSPSYKMILSYQIKGVFLTKGPVLLYDNLQTMIASITKCFDEKAYYYENANDFEVDFELESEINALLNPKTMYLKSL